MRRVYLILAAGLLATLPGCHKRASQAPSTTTAAAATTDAAGTQQIAWREGDVDDGFAEAKETGKPVLLYWGAKWCPPCNQLKSTLFKDPAFIAETRKFVPVHLDGDTKGAQMWGERFGISGYPTVIILRPDRSEITRLSSSSGGANLADVLRAAALRTTSFDDLLKTAADKPASLTPDDWHVLADFDWQNDPKRFKDGSKAAPILQTLSAHAPDPALQRRFALLALTTAITPDDKGKVTLTPAQASQVASVVPVILSNPAEIGTNHLELTYAAPAMIAALPASESAPIAAKLIAALDKVAADPAMPVRDRLDTVRADLAFAKAAEGYAGHVPPAVLAKVKQRVAWADGAAKDAMTRQSAISSAADLLDNAGDRPGAVKLLTAELARSASPYYYMLDLSSLAEEDKDNAAAVDWARKAADGAQGPATRVQWAIAYSDAVIRLKPDDKAQVEASAVRVIDALAASPDDYYQRTSRKVSTWGTELKGWSDKHGGGDILKRLGTQMASACAKQGDADKTCRSAITA